MSDCDAEADAVDVGARDAPLDGEAPLEALSMLPVGVADLHSVVVAEGEGLVDGDLVADRLADGDSDTRGERVCDFEESVLRVGLSDCSGDADAELLSAADAER